jgi:hypothetical protein
MLITDLEFPVTMKMGDEMYNRVFDALRDYLMSQQETLDGFQAQLAKAEADPNHYEDLMSVYPEMIDPETLRDAIKMRQQIFTETRMLIGLFGSSETIIFHPIETTDE